ncbi:hypothetical protein MNBD_CHLOROFLEXI01-2046, partial [hydrothermal vent metagenome]
MKKQTLFLLSFTVILTILIIGVPESNAQEGGTYKVYLPIAEKPPIQIDPPPEKPTTMPSIYISDTTDTYALGCEVGIAALG